MSLTSVVCKTLEHILQECPNTEAGMRGKPFDKIILEITYKEC